MIQIRWKKLSRNVGIWLTTEVLLNLIGLDNFADYSEFLLANDLELYKKNHRTVKITEFPPQFCPQIAENCPIPGTVIKIPDLQANFRSSKIQVLQQKCRKLNRVCIKLICFDNHISRVDIAYFDHD